MKSVMSRSAFGRRVIPGTVLALAAATLSLAGPASAGTIELQGTVTGVGGAPLANVYVEVDNAADVTDTIDSTVTDATGHYEFSALPAGSVKVFFSAPDPALTLTSVLPYQDRWSGGSRYFEGATATTIAVDPATAPTVNANLPQYASIIGNVTVAEGHVATGGAGWNVYDADWNNSYDNSSIHDPWYDTYYDNATGNFRLVVDPGNISVGAYAYDNPPVGPNINYLNLFWKNSDTLAGATPVSLSAGQTVIGINFRLTHSLTARQAPQIAGYPTVGLPLTATSGTWSRNAGTEFSYSWSRGATVVGTGPSYVPTVADFGQRLAVTVTALNGEYSGQAATVTTDVVRYAATNRVAAKAKAGRKVAVAVKVVSAKQSPVRGKVVVLRGTTVIKTGLKLVKGKVAFVLKNQPKGRQTYTVRFQGNSLLSKVDKSFTVRVHK